LGLPRDVRALPETLDPGCPLFEGGNVNKTEMAEKLAKKADITQAKAAEIVDIIFSTKDGEGIIAVELDAGRDVAIAGFGKFDTRRSKARTGRNPQTGTEIQIPARNVAKFTPAKGLKDRVST
jgi:DNA-binding protein HU-beta